MFSDAGATFAEVLKVNVYLTDVTDLRAADEVRREFFGPSRPASTLVEVARPRSAEDMNIEIEAVVGLRR